jgi:glycosyltransferase A (GT-A) superfamily protein (DUF2064 family)
MTNLVLIAKETLPGKVKTRLHPPLSLEQAAELAAASIADTLRATSRLNASTRILAFDGDPRNVPAGAEHFSVLPQVDGTLDFRLGAIFDYCQGPTLLIGMDTPQMTAEHLAPAFESWPHDIDAWFGPASDGGFWALALKNPTGDLLRGIPMSRRDTGRHQLKRLVDAGLRVGMLPELTDVDTIENAFDVAAIAPDGGFARTLERFHVTEGSLV